MAAARTTKTRQRVKIGKSFYVFIMMRVVATHTDGTPKWLEACGDDESMGSMGIAEGGSSTFYLVLGSELLAKKVNQT